MTMQQNNFDLIKHQQSFGSLSDSNQDVNKSGSRDLVGQLSHFFTQWQFFDVAEKKQAEKPIQNIDLASYQSFFNQFHSDYQQHYQQTGFNINIWDICGIKFDEVKHCQVLKWLLDAHGSHGLGVYFLQLFIEKVLPHHDFSVADFSDGYSIDTEIAFMGDGEDSDSRIDILIENKKAVLILEVKVNANETNNQMVRYFRIAEKLYHHKKWQILYLTKDGRKPTFRLVDDSEQEFDKMLAHVVTLSWRNIATILSQIINDKATNTFMRPLLYQYSQYIYRHF